MAKKQIRFGTLNLQNLQLAGEKMYAKNAPYTQAEYARKIAWLAQTVTRLDADVLAFQELWSAQCLVDVFKEAGLDGDYELLTASPVGKVGKGIAVALAVRSTCKAKKPTWIRDFPDEFVLKKRKSSGQPDYQMNVDIGHFSRPVLRCSVEPPDGDPILVFVAHMKSMLAMPLDKQEAAKPAVKKQSSAIGSVLSTVRRTAEAGALRVLLNKAMKDNDVPVVVMGDLNDSPDSVTLQILTGDPSYRFFSKSTAGQKSDAGLYSTGWLQDLRSFRDVVYTYVHEGRHGSLDHILVSEQFSDYSKKRQWSFRDLRVLNDHLDERSTTELARVYSDHGGLAATFDYYPA